MAAREF